MGDWSELSEIFSRVLRGSIAFEGVDPSRWPWERVVRCAHHHLLAPRLHRLLSESNTLKAVPERFAESLTLGAYSALSSNLLFESVAPALLRDLGSRGLEPVPLKGLILAKRFYDRPEERLSHDLDLLFKEESRPDVERFFERNGFARKSDANRFEANAHKTDFVSVANPALVVECHFALAYGAFNPADAWARSVPAVVDGIAVRCLDPIDEYLYLVFHAAVQHRFQKLGWVLDLAEIESRQPLDHQALAAAAERMSLGAALKMTSYFLKRYAAATPQGATEERNKGYDRWFAAIAAVAIERSMLRKARIRAMMHGGWMPALRYGAQRRKALARRP